MYLAVYNLKNFYEVTHRQIAIESSNCSDGKIHDNMFYELT